jgi:hypothetical protein
MTSTILQHDHQRPADRIAWMSAEGRRYSYEEGELTRAELFAWAALFPDEVPLINGEFPWIAATLADLE